MLHRLAECTPAEWTAIMDQSNAYQQAMPDRILDLLRQTSNLVLAFPVDQLTHGLQTAALAQQDNASAPPG